MTMAIQPSARRFRLVVIALSAAALTACTSNGGSSVPTYAGTGASVETSPAAVTSPSPTRTHYRPPPIRRNCSPEDIKVTLEVNPGTASMLLNGDVRLVGDRPCALVGAQTMTVLDRYRDVVAMPRNPNRSIKRIIPLRPNHMIVFTYLWLEPFCGEVFPYGVTFTTTGVGGDGFVPVTAAVHDVTPPKCPTAWGGPERKPRGLVDWET